MVSSGWKVSLYAAFDGLGLHYGPAFRTLVKVWAAEGGVAGARLASASPFPRGAVTVNVANIELAKK